MSTRKWHWIILRGAKAHMVCAGLLRQLLVEMTGRDCEIESAKLVGKGGVMFDMPGMIRVDRPMEAIPFLGTTLHIPSEDIATISGQLSDLPRRMFKCADGSPGYPYFKLHGFLRCLVLTPSQRTLLLRLLQERVADAEAKAKSFYADKAPMSQVLREVAAHVSKSPIESIPDLGGHRTDRFHDKTRGEA